MPMMKTHNIISVISTALQFQLPTTDTESDTAVKTSRTFCVAFGCSNTPQKADTAVSFHRLVLFKFTT